MSRLSFFLCLRSVPKEFHDRLIQTRPKPYSIFCFIFACFSRALSPWFLLVIFHCKMLWKRTNQAGEKHIGMANIIELAKTTGINTHGDTHTLTQAATWNCRSIMTAHPHTHTCKQANTHAHPAVVAPPLLEDFLLPHLHFQLLLPPLQRWGPLLVLPMLFAFSWVYPQLPSPLPIGNLFILRPFHICLGPFSMCSARALFDVPSVLCLSIVVGVAWCCC